MCVLISTALCNECYRLDYQTRSAMRSVNSKWLHSDNSCSKNTNNVSKSISIQQGFESKTKRENTVDDRYHNLSLGDKKH